MSCCLCFDVVDTYLVCVLDVVATFLVVSVLDVVATFLVVNILDVVVKCCFCLDVLATSCCLCFGRFCHFSCCFVLDVVATSCLSFRRCCHILFLYPPQTKFGRGVYRNHPVCLSVRPSVRLSRVLKLNLDYNF